MKQFKLLCSLFFVACWVMSCTVVTEIYYEIVVENQTKIPIDSFRCRAKNGPKWLTHSLSDGMMRVSENENICQILAGDRVVFDTVIRFMDIERKTGVCRDVKLVQVELIAQPDSTLRIEQRLQ